MLVGIDFGTTFSEIAALDYYKKIELLQDPGDYGIPSVFYYTEECDVCIGAAAVSNGISDAGNMVRDVKMRLGERFKLSEKEFSSEEIMQYIYKEIIETGIRCAGKKGFDNTEIEGIVLSFPNRFNDPERDFLIRSAATCMGEKSLPISGTIKEPVAAAIYYIEQNKNNPDEQMKVEDGDAVLVYDLGGGTCDVALVQYNSSEMPGFEVIDSDMLRKGGRDWDKKVSEDLKRQFDAHCQAKHRCIPETPELIEEIRKCAESMKKELSIKDKETVKEYMTYYYNAPQKVLLKLSLSRFNELTRELLEETMGCLQKMYEKHAGQYNITNVICVGGGSNMPQIKAEISRRIPECECRLWDPEYAIVKGAALYAYMLGKPEPEEAQAEHQISKAEYPPISAEECIISDIASFTYGIECYYNYDLYPKYRYIQNLIFKNRKLPASCDCSYNPTFAHKDYVTLSVYESDSEEETCELDDPTAKCIGKLEVQLPPEYQSVKTDILTHIVLNRNQTLEVTATLPDGSFVSAAIERFPLSK